MAEKNTLSVQDVLICYDKNTPVVACHSGLGADRVHAYPGLLLKLMCIAHGVGHR